jgi:DNA invertase Pin-like site-specific DNA recombinase
VIIAYARVSTDGQTLDAQQAALARTSEGRLRAKARGVRFGRKPTLTPHQRSEALARRAAGEACVEIARSYAVSHSTISRLAP